MSETQKPSEQAILSDIDFSDIPDEIGSYLDSELKSWSKHATLGQFQKTSFEGIDTYIVPFNVENSGTFHDKEDVVFLVDTDENGRKIGTGILAMGIVESSPLYGKPYVGYTGTEIGHTRRGLGARRLKLMNQLALKRHNQALHSAVGDEEDFSYEARKVWEKLVKNGEAEQVPDQTYTRFRFKPLH
jgi:hypothetical protein